MKAVINYSKDWKDKLFIDTKKIEELGELPVDIKFSDELTYSITPKTLKKVTFAKELSEPIFIEEYASKDSSVTRFGINIHNEKFCKQLDNELHEHNKQLAININKSSEKSVTNISGADKYNTFSTHIKLTECEKYTLQQAIDYMKINKANVILVDVLPRETKGITYTFKEEFLLQRFVPIGGIIPTEEIIIEKNTRKLDTHTVLLYKTVEDKILAIDPNNPMFSTHLSKYKGIETLCSTDEKYKIYSRPEKSETGFASNKFRDCVDIAVKLGLLLNQDKTAYKAIAEIMGSEAVKLITNNSKIDGMDFNISNLIRDKQSSDNDKVTSSNERMKEISDKITQEDLKYKEEVKKLEDEHFSILNGFSQTKNGLIENLQNEYSLYLLGNNTQEEA